MNTNSNNTQSNSINKLPPFGRVGVGYSSYFDMFVTFAKIGGFTLGGGYAMVPVMEKEIVDKKHWLGKEEFMDILVVAQSTPGLFAIDMASHIGYKYKGISGGIVCALAVAFIPIISILLIAMFFRTFKDNLYVMKFFMGVRPAVVALILAPCFTMAKTAKINRFNCWIPIVCALLICAFGVSPIWCILAAGVGGYVYGKTLPSPPVEGGGKDTETSTGTSSKS